MPPAPRCGAWGGWRGRSEEHTSELQSQSNLVCRLLLEKKQQAIGWVTDRKFTCDHQPYVLQDLTTIPIKIKLPSAMMRHPPTKREALRSATGDRNLRH